MNQSGSHKTQGTRVGSAPVASASALTRRELLVSAAGVGVLTTVGLGSEAMAKSAQSTVPVKIVPLPEQVRVTEGYLDVNGARLWYWDTGGKGQAVVLSHPATGSGASWGYQQPVFANAGYRVIGYSRRGHFKSEITDANAKAADVEDLKQLVDHLGLKRFHLVGSAAGTFIAAQYAVSHPQDLSSVVLSSSVIRIKDQEFEALLTRVIPAAFAMLPPDFRELGPSYRAANPDGTAQWIELEKKARISDALPPQPVSGGVAVTFENLAALKVPSLLLTGDCDLYACPAMLSYVAGRLGRNDMTIIDNAGHAAFWEQPEAYNAAVLRFIQRYKS